MGYIRHHAIIVTSWSDLTKAREKAIELGNTVTEIVESPINGYVTFVIIPDGSKEGWTNSDEGNTHRELFIEWLCEQEDPDDRSSPYAWAIISYGDEKGRLSIAGRR